MVGDSSWNKQALRALIRDRLGSACNEADDPVSWPRGWTGKILEESFRTKTLLMLASMDVMRGACVRSYDAATGMQRLLRNTAGSCKIGDFAPRNGESMTKQ